MIQRRRPAAALAAAAVAVLLAVLGPGLAALAQTTTSTGSTTSTTTPAAAPTDARPRLRMVDQTPFVSPTGAGATFVLRFRVDSAPPDAHLLFRLFGDVAGSGRIRFLDSLRPDGLGRPQRTIGPLPLENLPADREGVRTATFEVDATRQPLVGFQLGKEGVYPLAVSLREGDAGADVDTMVTSIIRLPFAARNDNPVFAFSLVVPLHAPVGLQTDGTTNLPADRARVLSALTDALAAHPGVPVTLEPTPETLDALAESGRDGTVNRLGSALSGRQLVSGPFVDLDTGSWVAAPELDGELTRQLDEGALTLQRRLGRPADRATWIVDATTTPDALTALHRRGVQRVVVPEDQLLPLQGRGFDVTLTRTFEVEASDGARLTAAMSDRSLRDHLLDSDDPRLNAQHVLADLAVLALDQPGVPRGAVLALPDALTPPDFVDALLTAFATPLPPDSVAKPLVAPVTLDGLFATAEPAGEQGGRTAGGGNEPVLVRGYLAAPPTSLGTYPTQLALARTSVGAYRSMLSPADSWRADPYDRLLAVSGAQQFDARQRQDHLDAAVAGVEGQAALVSLPEQPQVTLTAEDGRIPLAVQNDAPYPVTALLSITTDKLELPDGRSMVVTLQPGANRLDVPVKVRASGTIPVAVTLTSPDENLPLGTTRFTVRSTAVSGLGLVLSVAAGLFLLVWWARHFRSTRRQHRLVSPSHPSRRPGDGGDEPGDPTTAEAGRVDGAGATTGPQGHR